MSSICCLSTDEGNHGDNQGPTLTAIDPQAGFGTLL
jgi:hypothetical protein